MKRLLCLLCVLTLSSPAAWLSGRPFQASSIVEGTVVAAGTGQPLVRAKAILAKADNPTEKDSLSATTDGEGKFAIKNIAPGVYRLFVGHNGFVTAEYGQTGLDRAGVPIEVGADQAIRIPFSLTPVSTIAGKVVNQTGASVSSYLIRIFKARYENGERILSEVQRSETSEVGEFKLFDITPGWYFLGAASGQVYSPQELAVGIVNWPSFYGGMTEADAKPILLLPGETFNAGTLTILRTSAAHIRGQLLDAATGKPEINARILLGRKLRNDVVLSGQSAPVLRTGEFDLREVPPGNYILDVVTPTTAGSVTVEVRGQDISGLKIPLYPRITVSGHVQLDGRAAGLSRLRVVVSSGRPVAEGIVNPNGTFSIPGIPPGDYRVSLDGVSNIYLKSALLGTAETLNTGFHLAGTAEALLEITAGVTVADVDVGITDAAGNPASGAVAALIPDPSRRSRLELFRSAIAGPEGHARFIDVPPGDYTLLTWEIVEENAWQDPDLLRVYEAKGVPVHVGQSSTSVQAQVIPLW